MTVTINHTWYTNFGNGTTTGYYAMGKWTAGATVVAGQLIRQNATPTLNNERCFVYIVGGTSAAVTEPTWSLNKGFKTTDGSATVMECSGMPAVNGDAVNTPLSSQNRSGAQSLGNIIQNNAGTFYFICTTAGTTGAGEPSYVTTVGSTTTDGCTWTCIGAVGSFGAWAAPQARLQNALNPVSTWAIPGDTVYVSSIHAETQSSSTSITTAILGTAPPVTVICVNNGGNIPPQGTDVTTGASLSTTGASYIVFAATDLDIYGMTFNNATSGNTGISIGQGGGGGYVRLNNCQLVSNATSGFTVNIGSSGGVGFMGRLELVNTTIKTASNGNVIAIQGFFRWRDTPSAFSYTGSAPTILLGTFPSSFQAIIEGVDLSGFTGVTNYLSNNNNQSQTSLLVSGCKLASSTQMSNYAGSYYATQGRAEMVNCDSGAATYRHERWWAEGYQVIDTTVVRTGGASDGATALAWKIVVNPATSWINAYEALPIVIWNSVTGSNVTLTIQGCYNGATLPLYNDQIWLDARYFGTAASPLLSFASGAKSNTLTTHTAYSASTSNWDSIAVTRLNNTAYVIGNYFRLSSNPGQLFICTTAGTSSGSQPSAYTSVADGTLVTDGTAVFRPLMRFSMTVILSSPQPQIAGYIRCYVRAAVASATYWIDPYITLS